MSDFAVTSSVVTFGDIQPYRERASPCLPKKLPAGGKLFLSAHRIDHAVKSSSLLLAPKNFEVTHHLQGSRPLFT